MPTTRGSLAKSSSIESQIRAAAAELGQPALARFRASRADHGMRAPAMIVSFTLERDAAGQLAVALHALGARNRRDGRVFPATLILLQAVAENVIEGDEPMKLTISSGVEHSEGITGTQEPSPSGNRRDVSDDDSHDFLTRNDAARIAGVSIATVDRWIASRRPPINPNRPDPPDTP